MNWLAYLVTIAAGATNPLQAGANAELRRQLNSVLWSGCIIYLIGLLSMLLLQLLVRQPLPVQARFAGVRWWAWFGGAISIGATLAGQLMAQRLGSGIFTGLNVTAALVSSVLLDQFGVAGFKEHAVSPLRLAGCAVMICGVWMIARS